MKSCCFSDTLASLTDFGVCFVHNYIVSYTISLLVREYTVKQTTQHHRSWTGPNYHNNMTSNLKLHFRTLTYI